MPSVFVFNSDLVSGQACSWTAPTGVSKATFEVWGGGGGGGSSAATCFCCSRAGSGGGGGYASRTVDLCPGATYTICAGSGGKDSTCCFWGSACSYCQGGYNGSTSFVLDPSGLPVVCATGGTGAAQTSAGIYCSIRCGCVCQNGGQGYCGDINETGGPSVHSWLNSVSMGTLSMGGNAAGPGGGPGGLGHGFCTSACTEPGGANPYHRGVFPGGGGAGAGAFDCTCCPRPGGSGAAGLVKITW